MSIKNITLSCLLLLALIPSGFAQLFPSGTKLHTAGLDSYFNIIHQRYLDVNIHNSTGSNNKEYTNISYPDWRHSMHSLRLDSNKLYHQQGENEVLLFDFSAKENDSVSIYQYVFNVKNDPRVELGLARIRVDSIGYEYYYNEKNMRDSLKCFFYSGIVKAPLLPVPDTQSYRFKFSIVEKIITVYTTGSMRGYLSANVGARTLSDDHERLRCIEFPDGKMMKMEWWYKLAGDTFPCDHRFNVGLNESSERERFTFFPNPSSDKLMFKNYSGWVTIINSLGQEVGTYRASSTLPVNVASFPEGVYMMRFGDDPQTDTKFMIIR